MSAVEEIRDGDVLLAVIVRSRFREPGTSWFTREGDSLQLGYFRYSAYYTFRAHAHKKVERRIDQTCKAIFLQRGRLRIDFYNLHGERIGSRTLEAGDVALLVDGGYGFEVLQSSLGEAEFFEVKQGPYVGVVDKVWLESSPGPLAITLPRRPPDESLCKPTKD